MIHRIVGTPADTAVDLLGPVGLVWLALDEPATRNELTQRLYDAEVIVEDIDTELDRLLAPGLIVRTRVVVTAHTPRSRFIDLGVIVVLDTAIHVSSSATLVSELRRDLPTGGRSSRDPPHAQRQQTHRLEVALRDETWTVQWDGATHYRGPSIDLALYDSLIVLNHHFSAGDGTGVDRAPRRSGLHWRQGGCHGRPQLGREVDAHDGVDTTASAFADEVSDIRDDFAVARSNVQSGFASWCSAGPAARACRPLLGIDHVHH